MRLWYWFSLTIVSLGSALVIIGYQYPSIGGDNQQGFTIMTYGSIALAFALALSIIYFFRWKRFWINRPRVWEENLCVNFLSQTQTFTLALLFSPVLTPILICSLISTHKENLHLHANVYFKRFCMVSFDYDVVLSRVSYFSGLGGWSYFSCSITVWASFSQITFTCSAWTVANRTGDHPIFCTIVWPSRHKIHLAYSSFLYM